MILKLIIHLALASYLLVGCKANDTSAVIPTLSPVEITEQRELATSTPKPINTLRPTPTPTRTISNIIKPIATVMSGDKGEGTWLNYEMDEIFDLVAGDTIWLAAATGVFQFNPTNNEITNLSNNAYLNAIAVDHSGHLWIATGREGLAPCEGYGGGVSEFDGQTWKTHIQKEARTCGAVIYEVSVDNVGHVWSNTAEGLGEFDGHIWKTYPMESILAMTTDETGKRWFGGSRYGVRVFDGENWTQYIDELSDDTVTAIASSGTGQIWFGTLNGVTKFDGENWTTYTTADGLAKNVVWSIAVDRAGDVWVGHGRAGGGVSKFDGETWVIYSQTDGLASNVVHVIATDEKGHIWFGTDVGLSKFTSRSEVGD